MHWCESMMDKHILNDSDCSWWSKRHWLCYILKIHDLDITSPSSPAWRPTYTRRRSPSTRPTLRASVTPTSHWGLARQRNSQTLRNTEHAHRGGHSSSSLTRYSTCKLSTPKIHQHFSSSDDTAITARLCITWRHVPTLNKNKWM